MYILSQVLVGLADLLYVFSMLTKKKSALLIFLLFSDVLFAFHYLCLNALTGCITIFIDVAFLLTTYLIERLGNKKCTFIAVICAMVGTILTCVFTWVGPISLLPLFSMLIYLTGMIFSNIVFVKGGAMCRNILNIIYMLLIASYIGAGLEFTLMVSAIVGIVLNIRNKKKQENIEQNQNSNNEFN